MKKALFALITMATISTSALAGEEIQIAAAIGSGAATTSTSSTATTAGATAASTAAAATANMVAAGIIIASGIAAISDAGGSSTSTVSH